MFDDDVEGEARMMSKACPKKAQDSASRPDDQRLCLQVAGDFDETVAAAKNGRRGHAADGRMGGR